MRGCWPPAIADTRPRGQIPQPGSAGVFSGRQCAAAFANARAQLRDRAPRFAGSGECRLRFHMCDPIHVEAPLADGDEDAMSYAPTEATAYIPAALGVEIVASRNGVESAPTLAIETQEQLFSYYPVSRPYEPRQQGETVAARSDGQSGQQNAAILAPDHFEPFSRRKPFAGSTTFTASALGAIESSTASGDETAEARRMRLRNAPFIE